MLHVKEVQQTLDRNKIVVAGGEFPPRYECGPATARDGAARHGNHQERRLAILRNSKIDAATRSLEGSTRELGDRGGNANLVLMVEAQPGGNPARSLARRNDIDMTA
ncbi:MAG: hypothetical protein KIT09_00785 [Bryobacteraceae bacterium]|nr:hypothetical protein [Bryobacteraceae bacterium]